MSKGARKGKVNKKMDIQNIKPFGVEANILPKNYFLPEGKFTAKYNRELNNGSTKKC